MRRSHFLKQLFRAARVALPLAVITCAATASAAAPIKLRFQTDQKGDFVLFGNTLGHECDSAMNMFVSVPVVGTAAGAGRCGAANNPFGQADSPDIYWISDSPAAGQAEASQMFTAAQARTTSMLIIPAGAQITKAFLYWSGAGVGNNNADTMVTLDAPGAPGNAIVADESYVDGAQGGSYLGVTDVTMLVQGAGPGAYRVSGVNSNIVNQDDRWAAWWMVVFYQDTTQPPRNLALFDLFQFLNAMPVTGTVSGFTVPNAGFDAKLGVVTFEGDGGSNGDRFFFNPSSANPPNSEALTDALNPQDNFFNSTRSFKGTAVSNPGDLPQLTGLSQSMGGMDMDVVDVTSKVKAGDTSATFRATTTGDVVMFTTFVTSISTFKPDFSSSGKSVVDVNGGSTVKGDELEYTVVVTNNGNDASVGTTLTDVIPNGVTYVPNSTTIDGVATMDAVDADTVSYDGGTKTLTAFLGTGATPTMGGTLAIGGTVTVKFRVTVDGTVNGTINNQAVITAAGAMGSPAGDTPTDGNGVGMGQPPTPIVIDECGANGDCMGATPVCDTGASPKVCVGCLADTDCSGTAPICNTTTKVCEACTTNAQCGAGKVCDPGGACVIDPTTDTDGDGLPDATETMLGTNPMDADTDDDGVSDGQEVTAKTNPLKPDTDGDGILDGTELGLGCGGPGTDASKCVPDADMGATKTDPLKVDTDAGGELDGSEDANKNGKIDAGERDPNNPADDVKDKDTDGDGLPDMVEMTLGTNPMDADSDDDGVPDGQEVMPGVDSDGDGLINALDPDSDNDGLFDGTEMGLGCSSPATDATKKACVADADMGATKTDPLKADTDGGGIKDGVEDANRNGKIDAGEGDPNNPADDTGKVDTDKDGLTDDAEKALGTDPMDADSDDDGVKDGEEVNPSADTDGDGKVNALDADSDGDGLFDGTELGKGCSDPATDASKKTCVADADPATKTSPVIADTDKGGVKDGDEDTNKNGKVDAGERNPLDPKDDMAKDTDGDGLTDDEEKALGTDPTKPDTDGDGLKDGDEVKTHKTDPKKADTDGGGVNDGDEVNKDKTNPLDPKDDKKGGTGGAAGAAGSSATGGTGGTGTAGKAGGAGTSVGVSGSSAAGATGTGNAPQAQPQGFDLEGAGGCSTVPGSADAAGSLSLVALLLSGLRRRKRA